MNGRLERRSLPALFDPRPARENSIVGMHIAVDLGAGSGRVFLVAFDADELILEELNRFVYPPRFSDGALRWDLEAIFDGVVFGLQRAVERARELKRPLESLGLDSWAVDYGWVDDDGAIVADPVCYRDNRTAGVPERVFQSISRQQIFEKTGIQIQRFNTLYQLCSEIPRDRGQHRMVLVPDLITYKLTGSIHAEYTNGTTTQLMNIESVGWDHDLLKIAALSETSVPPIVKPGSVIGPLRLDGYVEPELQGLVVIAPATHDTASAVAAAPIESGIAYISSGTWSLVGIETREPIISELAAEANFTNEGGVYGTFRFLKNVMGLWIFECCRREWRSAGVDVEYDALLDGLNYERPSDALIYPDDERFLNPETMLDAIAAEISETGQRMPQDPPAICKMIFDSLALRYASVLMSIERIAGEKISAVEVLGGGGQNRYLVQMTANAFGRPVRAGPVEATVIGNALVQAITLGRFAGIDEGRKFIADHHERHFFEPKPVAGLASTFEC